ncbi:MAG: cytosine permease [Oscillospiraceae bacterium]|nr:cytosine permease [Oscillospiraceae bacterium]
MSTYTQVQRNGLFELSDSARQELMNSKYYNDDLAPSSVAERTWSTYTITMLWVGMSICIPSLSLASGLVGMGVSPWLAILNVALGNLIILIPIQLNSTIGTQYGIPFPLFARLTFGLKGAQLPSLLRGFTACGWCSVQAWVGGGAFAAIIGCFAPRFLDPNWTIGLPSWGGIQTASAGTFIGYILFMGLILWVAYNGLENIKWVQNIGGPILIVMMILLLIWSIHYAGTAGYTFSDTLNASNNQELLDANGGFAYVYLTGLMGNIAFWATMALNIPDFSRYAKNNKSQFWGQMLGMPIPMAFCAFVGTQFGMSTLLVDGEAKFDPTNVFYYLDNKFMVFIGAVGVVMATITTCVAANVVAPANAIANLNPKKLGYRKGVLITVLFAFFILQAWWIYGSGSAYFNWMNAYGTVLAPIAALLIADYWVVKKKRIDILGLFGANDRYQYSGGFNWAAIIAWFVAFIVPLVAYFGMSGGFWTFLAEWNYVWSFVIGFIVYLILMKTSLAGKSYLTEEEYAEITQFED